MAKTVLDIGSGPQTGASDRLRYKVFDGWRVVRLDIDPSVKPDIVGSVTDIAKLSSRQSFDAIWSSHVIEHLDDHLVQATLDACYRVLRRDGFAIITCPDLQGIAQLIVNGDPDEPAYHSPAGPISPIDMLFGHRASIARGNSYMAHRTGFTAKRLSSRIVEAGFGEVWIAKGNFYDLWAVALMPSANRAEIARQISTSNLSFIVAG